MTETKLFKEIAALETEQRNPVSSNIDKASTREILEIINSQDMLVSRAVSAEIENIGKAVDGIVDAFKAGGRLFYFGAGTSGRLGVVDASECPPTFGTDPEMVQGIIAGGREAMFVAQEGAEDSEENGGNELEERGIDKPDVVCGIAASGRTPFVKGAVNGAKEKGIFTIMISTVPRHKVISLGINADVYICPDVGPEVITGSTRMKSGTAQKMVLNMLTTAAMVRMGKTHGNIMVDLQLTNAKLVERAKKTIMTICNVDYATAGDLLEKSQGHVKSALVMSLGEVDYPRAQELLEKAKGFVRVAIDMA